jgi:hypothetical protein
MDDTNKTADAATAAQPSTAPAAATVTTLTSGDRPQPDQTQPIEQVKAAEPAPVDPVDQVTVQAIRSFEGIEGFKNPQSAPFTVSKLRAADLFAVGLIEYVDPADEDAAIDEQAEKQVEAVKTAAASRRTKKPKS